MLESDQAGAGSTVVLLHAAVGDRRLWNYQWPWLTATHRGLRCDLRGFGRTPVSAEPYSHAQDVLALIDTAGVERAVLVGGSLGGRVALEMAVSRPALVAGLLLVSPSMLGYDWSDQVRAFGDAEDEALAAGDIDAAVELNLRMWYDGRGRPSAAMDGDRRAAVGEMQRRAFDLQLAAGDGAVEEPLVEDLQDRVGEIAVPTLVVVGEHDVADFHAIGTRLGADLPDASYQILPGTAHVPNYERPETFDVVLANFLARRP